jgi:hypothetical protein
MKNLTDLNRLHCLIHNLFGVVHNHVAGLRPSMTLATEHSHGINNVRQSLITIYTRQQTKLRPVMCCSVSTNIEASNDTATPMIPYMLVLLCLVERGGMISQVGRLCDCWSFSSVACLQLEGSAVPPESMQALDGAAASLTSRCYAAAQVGAMLPSCIQLASRIIDAGENVVANNARCTDLVQHVSFIDRLLHRLQSAMARCGVAGRCTACDCQMQLLAGCWEQASKSCHRTLATVLCCYRKLVLKGAVAGSIARHNLSS